MHRLSEENAPQHTARNGGESPPKCAVEGTAESAGQAQVAKTTGPTENTENTENTEPTAKPYRLTDDSLSLTAGAALGIGGVGVVLAFADIASPLRAPFTLFFLIVAPAAAIGAALPGVDPLSRPVLAVAGAVAVDLLVAQVMLAQQAWSARGGVVAVGVVSLLFFLLASARRVRRRVTRGRA